MLEDALRYMGAAGGDEALRTRVSALLEETRREFPPRYAYRLSRVEMDENGVRLPDIPLTLPGNLAAKMLGDCRQAVVLVCTLGLQFEQRMLATQAKDMTQALMLDACGSALVEHGCDLAEAQLRERFPQAHLTDRFSPGYGDLPLTLQPDICRALDSRRRLGVYVSSTCMLTPQKSVTAIIGLADAPQRARIRGCAYCALREQCALRKGGHSCEV